MYDPVEELRRMGLSLLGGGALFIGVLICFESFRISPWVKVIAAGLAGLLLVVLLSQAWYYAQRYWRLPLPLGWEPGQFSLLLEVCWTLSVSLIVLGPWGFLRDMRRRLSLYQLQIVQLSTSPKETRGQPRPWKPD